MNNTSKALKARNTGKRKRDNNEGAECPDHSDFDASAEFADMDINTLKNEMVLDSERRSEMVEAAVKKCTCAKTLQEKTDIGEFARKKHLAKKTAAGDDGSITLRADSRHAFETLKYIFDMSLH